MVHCIGILAKWRKLEIVDGSKRSIRSIGKHLFGTSILDFVLFSELLDVEGDDMGGIVEPRALASTATF